MHQVDLPATSEITSTPLLNTLRSLLNIVALIQAYISSASSNHRFGSIKSDSDEIFWQRYSFVHQNLILLYSENYSILRYHIHVEIVHSVINKQAYKCYEYIGVAKKRRFCKLHLLVLRKMPFFMATPIINLQWLLAIYMKRRTSLNRNEKLCSQQHLYRNNTQTIQRKDISLTKISQKHAYLILPSVNHANEGRTTTSTISTK